MIVLGVVIAISAAQKYLRRGHFAERSTPAQRKIEWVSGIWGGSWVLSQIALTTATRTGAISEPFKLKLAIAVVALIGLAYVWTVYRWVLKCDELIRRIETEALALGLGLGVIGIVAADQLGSAGIGLFASPAMDPGTRFLLPIFLGYGIARFYVYQRYR
jgi:hypothetical protein